MFVKKIPILNFVANDHLKNVLGTLPKNVSPSDTVIILDQCWEIADIYSLAKQIRDKIQDLRRLGFKIIMVLNACYRPSQCDDFDADDIIFIEFFTYWVYHKLIKEKVSKVSTQWNPQNTEFLFFIGKLDKPNRLRLLYKFYKKNMLDKCIWSLFVTNEQFESCCSLMFEVSPAELKSFVAKHSKKLDDIEWSTSFTGIPYDVDLFSRSKFRVISETLYDSWELRNAPESKGQPFLTEKTYITIANKLPFIMCGESGAMEKLKSLGFKTFEEYTPISGFDAIIDGDERLEAVIENTRAWLEHMPDTTSVNADVEHNYKIWIEQSERVESTLKTIINKHDLGCNPEDLLIIER